jgi:hypothetical protein
MTDRKSLLAEWPSLRPHLQQAQTLPVDQCVCAADRRACEPHLRIARALRDAAAAERVRVAKLVREHGYAHEGLPQDVRTTCTWLAGKIDRRTP